MPVEKMVIKQADFDFGGASGVDSDAELAAWNAQVQKAAGRDIQVVLKNGQTIDIHNNDLKDLTKEALNTKLAQTGDNRTPADDNAKRSKALEAQLEAALQKHAELSQNSDKNADEILRNKDEMRQLIKKAEANNLVADAKVDVSKYKGVAGTGDGEGGSQVKAEILTPQSGGSSAQQSSTAAKTMYPGVSGGAAAQVTSGAAQFNSSAYLQTMNLESNMQNSYDQINQNTNQGKNLLQLFFYFAKMAESGDMGAMYQFTKFLTYIITKDKAKQNIEMGKQLITLQEMSRQWTNKLLNMSTDASDATASNKLMVTMTQVKSETDAIATSQKLIGQMMEEFSQVSEVLTNLSKGTLDYAGKLAAKASSITVM